MTGTHEEFRCVACGHVAYRDDFYSCGVSALIGTGRGHILTDTIDACPYCLTEGEPEAVEVCNECGEVVEGEVCQCQTPD